MRRDSLVLLRSCAGASLYALTRTADQAETRYTGAYVLEDGTSRAFIAPREGEVLRYRLMNGESGALWPTPATDDTRAVAAGPSASQS